MFEIYGVNGILTREEKDEIKKCMNFFLKVYQRAENTWKSTPEGESKSEEQLPRKRSRKGGEGEDITCTKEFSEKKDSLKRMKNQSGEEIEDGAKWMKKKWNGGKFSTLTLPLMTLTYFFLFFLLIRILV